MQNFKKSENGSLLSSPIVFGTSCFGNLYRAIDFETKLAISREWFKHVRKPVFIDSAGKYGAGLALKSIGRCLRKLQIQTDDVIISNKLGWKQVPLTSQKPTFEPGVWFGLKHDAVQDISYSGIMECYEQGCELIGAEYAPVMVSVHDPDEYLASASDEKDRAKRLADIIEGYNALYELKAAGKVKAVGIGSKDWRVIKEVSSFVNLDWVMFACSLTLYRHESELIEFINELDIQGVEMINSAVFNAGFLIGGDFFDYTMPDPLRDAELFKWRDNFFAACECFNVTPASACIQYGMRFSGIRATALNTSKATNIERNIRCIEEVIPSGFWDELERQNII